MRLEALYGAQLKAACRGAGARVPPTAEERPKRGSLRAVQSSPRGSLFAASITRKTALAPVSRCCCWRALPTKFPRPGVRNAAFGRTAALTACGGGSDFGAFLSVPAAAGAVLLGAKARAAHHAWSRLGLLPAAAPHCCVRGSTQSPAGGNDRWRDMLAVF